MRLANWFWYKNDRPGLQKSEFIGRPSVE